VLVTRKGGEPDFQHVVIYGQSQIIQGNDENLVTHLMIPSPYLNYATLFQEKFSHTFCLFIRNEIRLGKDLKGFQQRIVIR
jgi:hypothetical protein